MFTKFMTQLQNNVSEVTTGRALSWISANAHEGGREGIKTMITQALLDDET